MTESIKKVTASDNYSQNGVANSDVKQPESADPKKIIINFDFNGDGQIDKDEAAAKAKYDKLDEKLQKVRGKMLAYINRTKTKIDELEAQIAEGKPVKSFFFFTKTVDDMNQELNKLIKDTDPDLSRFRLEIQGIESDKINLYNKEKMNYRWAVGKKAIASADGSKVNDYGEKAKYSKSLELDADNCYKFLSEINPESSTLKKLKEAFVKEDGENLTPEQIQDMIDCAKEIVTRKEGNEDQRKTISEHILPYLNLLHYEKANYMTEKDVYKTMELDVRNCYPLLTEIHPESSTLKELKEAFVKEDGKNLTPEQIQDIIDCAEEIVELGKGTEYQNNIVAKRLLPHLKMLHYLKTKEQ